MSASFILLDIGGTDIKTAVVSTESEGLRNLRRVAFPKFLQLEYGLKEVDANELFKLVKAEVNLQIDNLVSVGGLLISGQMACWKVSKFEEGNENRIISWQDNRSTKLRDIHLRGELLAANGGESKIGLPALGLLQTLDGTINSGNGSSFETMGSWVARKLCNAHTLSQTHITDAAATGIYDIYLNKWVPELLDEKLNGIIFPDVKTNIEAVGFLTDTSIPIYVPVGDQQASLLGAGLDKTKIAVNIGTGGQVAMISQGKAPDKWLVRPYFSGQFIHTKTHLPAGRLISSIQELLTSKYNFHLDYKDISTIELGGSNLISRENLYPEKCEEIFEMELDSGKSILDVLCLILTSIAAVYVETIRDLENPNNFKILFAGGVGQKFTNFHKYFERELGGEIEVSATLETTLQGLAELILGL